jgi:hypothetical protein
MIPLILIALGLGAVAAYEFSPKTHAWIDEHVQAFKDAVAAHKAAEAHLDAVAQAAPSNGAPAPDVQLAQDHAAAAQAATAVAADKTAKMAQTARTQAQRATATWMAALTLAMQDQIKALAALQIARGAEMAAAKMAFDDAVARIARAKSELSRLSQQRSPRG